jgi:protein-L-isoaspartate(D-aspartate) O-methyltransferase
MAKQHIKSSFYKRQRHFFGYLTRGVPLVLMVMFAIFPMNFKAMSQNWEVQRHQMVNRQIKPRNVQSNAVLEAMKVVPRHLFVPKDIQHRAYEDRPLPIGLNQTISQPYIVAYMTEQIDPKPGMKVLEIGTGSGYQAAILAQIGCDVYTIELLDVLASRAEKTLKELGYQNVKVRCGDGYLGWPEESPFDAIIITAAPEFVPPKLVEQLKDGGIMVVPVGPLMGVQSLKLITKTGKQTSEKNLIPVRFVPMVRERDFEE